MDSKDNVIEELRALTAKQAAQIEKLTARIDQLELQLAKAKKDSTTSSKPPSSDIAKPKPKQRPGPPEHVTEHRLTVYRDADGNLYVPDCAELKPQSTICRKTIFDSCSQTKWSQPTITANSKSGIS